MKYKKGSTLIEILMYIALYSILFSSFIFFVFSLQKTLITYQTRYDDMYEVLTVKSLLMTYIDRTSDYQVHEQMIVLKSGKILDSKYFNRLFQIPLDSISFAKKENILSCTVIIRGTEYIININIL